MKSMRYQIARLELKAGDILVAKLLRKNVSHEDVVKIQDGLSRFVGAECRVLVVDAEMDVSVIRGAPQPAVAPILDTAGR